MTSAVRRLPQGRRDRWSHARAHAQALRHQPATIEHNGKNAKGYRREWFLETWDRYAVADAPSQKPADDASGSSDRQDRSENGDAERDCDLTDAASEPSQDPSGLDAAVQSEHGTDPDALTDLTDELPPRPRAHSTEPTPAEQDADVLDLLAQAERFEIADQVTLVPDPTLGELDPALWLERNGYPRAKRKESDKSAGCSPRARSRRSCR